MATSQEQSAVDSPKPTYTISTSHKKTITCIAWLPGDRLVTGSFDRTVRIWNLTDGTQKGTSMVHEQGVREIVATKDGRIVSCCFDDKHLTVWNADTQELVERPRSNQDCGRPRWITLTQNEELLASCHWGDFVFWEMAGTVRVRSHFRVHDERRVGAACFSPNGSRLAVCCEGRLSIFNVETGERIFRSPNAKLNSYYISWSLDGHRVFCGNAHAQIRCYPGESVGEAWIGHTGEVNCTSLSLDGRWLASGSNDRTVRFWDAESGDLVGEPHPHDESVDQIAFSRSGEFLASVCYSRISPILIWRVPWWDDQNQNTPNALLDMSAVVSPDASDPSELPDLGVLDVSSPRRPLPPQTHSRANPSSGPPRVQDSVRSWQWWKRIPRLVFLRSHSIYTGRGPPRIAVASWENVDNSQRSESQSNSEENSEGWSDTPPAGLEPKVGELEVGCCGFLSRQQPRATAAQGRRHVRGERSSRSDRPPTSENAGIPIPTTSTHTAMQDILELSAVVRSADTT